MLSVPQAPGEAEGLIPAWSWATLAPARPHRKPRLSEQSQARTPCVHRGRSGPSEGALSLGEACSPE